MGDLINRHQDI